MNKSFFEEQSKKAEVPSDLRALFKINAGLQELQKSKQQPEPSGQPPSGTVAQQIQQQGIAALNQPPEAAVTPSPAVQTTPDTPMGDVAMQANVGQQIQAAEQQKMQQQMQQMMQQQMASQQPQPMARGGIAALTANNMRNFQRGGVVGFFNGGEARTLGGGELPPGFNSPEKPEEQQYLELNPFDPPEIRAYKTLKNRELLAKAYNDPSRDQDMLKEYLQQSLSRAPQAAPQADQKQTPPAAPRQAAPESASAPMMSGAKYGASAPPPQPAPAEGGIASLMPAAPRADFAAFEKDKAAALAAAREQILPTAQTVQQRRASREAEAKAAGVDLYGTEAKDRIAAREKEFASLSAARDEANKDRAKQNLITMLVNSGGESSLFAGLAKGTKAYQAAEKLQKADDLIWGGKKIEFMQNIDNQRELINERNKATLLGDIAAVNQIDEAIRIGKNTIATQISDVYSKSMDRNAQAAISAATNATQVAIAKMKERADIESRKLAKEGQNINALESRILENSRLNATTNKLLDESFRKNNPENSAYDAAGIKRKPEEQAKWDAIKAAHENEKAKQTKFFEEQNYNLQYRKWLMFDKQLGLPEPAKPDFSEDGGMRVLGLKKQ